ncbi:MAG: type II secretion system F family protein [Acidimicrobiia bacterium]
MSRLFVLALAGAWVGCTLLLAELRWFRREPLAERLRRYSGAPEPLHGRNRSLSAASFRDVIGPLVSAAAERLVSALGVDEDLTVRLRRLHAPIDATAFRLRQAAWAGGALLGAAALALTLAPPAPVALLFVVGAPLLAFLVIEQRLAGASTRRQAHLFDELPVVMEQLGMLLGAGYSLGSALSRLAERGRGVVAEDLALVVNRVRQGLSEEQALREWASLAAVPELDRLVTVLALNHAGTDLGRLVAEEARAVRREAHRRTLELIERRAQLVWIPVTVATLVPGVVFMAVPFLEALHDFAAL